MPVRPMRASAGSAQFRAFIPRETHPLQVLHQLSFVTLFAALKIGVFNAEDEVAPGMPGVEPVVESGAGVAYMEESGRGWRETDAGFLD